jgi:hypothetical protein
MLLYLAKKHIEKVFPTINTANGERVLHTDDGQSAHKKSSICHRECNRRMGFRSYLFFLLVGWFIESNHMFCAHQRINNNVKNAREKRLLFIIQ